MTQTLMRSGKSLLIAAALALLAAGCNHAQSDKDVIAKVNSYKILRSELDKAYKRNFAGTPEKPWPEQERQQRLQLLIQLIGRQLYLQKAEKLGVVVTDEELTSRVDEAKAPYTKEDFSKRLQQAGFDNEDDYKQDLRQGLTIEKVRNKEVASKVNISDEEIQNYYNQNKAQFNFVEPQYSFAQILVTTQPNPQIAGKAQNEAQARDKIRMIYNRLESGEDFGVLADRYSEDPDTAHNGGVVARIPESSLKNGTDPATRDAVLKLKRKDQYSDVITIVNPATQKPVAFRIVKLLGKQPAGQIPLDEVRQAIRTQLRNLREQTLITAYEELLRDGADIHNYYAEQIMKEAGQK